MSIREWITVRVATKLHLPVLIVPMANRVPRVRDPMAQSHRFAEEHVEVSTELTVPVQSTSLGKIRMTRCTSGDSPAESSPISSKPARPALRFCSFGSELRVDYRDFCASKNVDTLICATAQDGPTGDVHRRYSGDISSNGTWVL